MNIDWDSVLQYLLFPAAVALVAAYYSQKGAHAQQRQYQRDQDDRKKNDLSDRLMIEISKLSSLFDSLRKDVESRGIFLLTSVYSARTIANKLQILLDQVVIYRNEDLRRKIISIVDEASTLIEDIYSTEQYPVNKYTDLENTKTQLRKELREVRQKLISFGYYLSQENRIEPLPTTPQVESDPMIKILNDSILAFIVGELSDKQAELDRAEKENEKARTLLTMRILDIQTKLRELIALLKYES